MPRKHRRSPGKRRRRRSRRYSPFQRSPRHGFHGFYGYGGVPPPPPPYGYGYGYGYGYPGYPGYHPGYPGYAGGGFSTSDTCLEDGQARQVLFLEKNCAGFPTGPICCPGQRDVVYCQGNVEGGLSVGTLQCLPKDD